MVHSLAASGFKKGTNEFYDMARPSYQPYVLSYIRPAAGNHRYLRVVEFGSGTGIFTRALLTHPDWETSIAELKAIEPSEGMREIFTRKVSDARVNLAEGTFDKADSVGDGWADLIVAAQCYHWCQDHNAAMKEFSRILKPGGCVVFVWNLEDENAFKWAFDVFEASKTIDQGRAPLAQYGLWRSLFETQTYKEHFNPPVEKIWKYCVPATLESVVRLTLSFSYVAGLPDEDKEHIAKLVGEIVERGEGKVWIDEEKGLFEYPYWTLVEIMQRK